MEWQIGIDTIIVPFTPIKQLIEPIKKCMDAHDFFCVIFKGLKNTEALEVKEEEWVDISSDP
jgi:hypothetical protein